MARIKVAKAAQKPVVLELQNVTFLGKKEHSVKLRGIDLKIRQGDMLMLHLHRTMKTRELSSMLQGLSRPTAGKILFQNADWLGEDYDRHFAMRSRIGRVFEDQAWIENMNVVENIGVAGRHHGLLQDDWNVDIEKWADRFGVDLAHARPSFVEPSRLQVHQWIRALISRPALLLLERPMRAVPAAVLPKLIEAIDEHRRRGGAVIWYTSSPSHYKLPIASPVQHYQLLDDRLADYAGVGVHE